MEKRAKVSDIAKRFASHGVFPFQMAFTLLIPLRNIFLSPRQLVKRLELRDDMNVLEVGPGPGYFSPHLARALAKGELVLADIQQEMLDYAKKRLEKKGLANVGYYLCDGNTLDFPEGTFDRIVMVTVLGEVENKDAYMREFYRILDDDGILSISEQAGDPDRMTVEELRELASEFGFEFYRQYGSKRNYTVNFRKKN